MANQNLRDEVLSELALFLKGQNKPKKKNWFGFLEKPFVLTVLGGLIVTYCTSRIQSFQRQTELKVQYQQTLDDKKLQLLRSLPTLYQSQGNTLNSMLVRVLWLADDTGPKVSPDEIRKQLDNLHEKYSAIEPVDGVLTQIEVLFDSGTVKFEAGEMKKKFNTFEELVMTTVQKRNSIAVLPKDEVEEIRKKKSNLVNSLESAKNKLVTLMAQELKSPIVHP